MLYSEENKLNFSFIKEYNIWENYFTLNPEKFAYLFPIFEEKDYFSFVTQKINNNEQLDEYHIIIEYNNESGILNTYLLIKETKKKYIIKCWDVNKKEYSKKKTLKIENINLNDMYYCVEEPNLMDGTSFYILSSKNNKIQRFCLYTKFWINKDFNKLSKLFEYIKAENPSCAF